MEVISYLQEMKHLAYLPDQRNRRLIMKRIILILVALIGLTSYLSAQVEIGDGGTNLIDTYGDEVFGLSFDLHYEANTIGSHTEWTK